MSRGLHTISRGQSDSSRIISTLIQAMSDSSLRPSVMCLHTLVGDATIGQMVLYLASDLFLR